MEYSGCFKKSIILNLYYVVLAQTPIIITILWTIFYFIIIITAIMCFDSVCEKTGIWVLLKLIVTSKIHIM